MLQSEEIFIQLRPVFKLSLSIRHAPFSSFFSLLSELIARHDNTIICTNKLIRKISYDICEIRFNFSYLNMEINFDI